MSFGELLFLSVLALLVFGPRRLPEIARTAGKWMTELRRASNEFRYSLEDEVRMLDLKEKAQRQPPPAAPLPLPGTAPRQELEATAPRPEIAAPAPPTANTPEPEAPGPLPAPR